MHEKAKFVCFIYMQQQKEKFKSVQISMQWVKPFVHLREIALWWKLCELTVKTSKILTPIFLNTR